MAGGGLSEWVLTRSQVEDRCLVFGRLPAVGAGVEEEKDDPLRCLVWMTIHGAGCAESLRRWITIHCPCCQGVPPAPGIRAEKGRDAAFGYATA